MEEEVVFKLLCQVEKVGSLIGKGGSIIRALQNETGASIKIADAAAPENSDERVVLIAAREDAVIRVHGLIAEIGFEPGAAVVARLLVHSQQMGCLFGKGGLIIAELRRVIGTSIYGFLNEQVPKYGSQNDEVVQVEVAHLNEVLLRLQNLLENSKNVQDVSGGKSTFRREKVKGAMLHAWTSYKKYAWGQYVLQPQSKNGVNSVGGLGATLVDSLDAL